jgi:uncharacterized protein involved in exopolysaccharide biosynthesis
LVEAQKVPETLVRTTVTTPIEDRLQAISQQILSRTRLQGVIEKFNLYQSNAPHSEGWIATWWERLRSGRPAESSSAPVTLDHVERLRRNIDIQVPKGRSLGSTISIAFIGDDPRTVMDVTNELASLFIEENLRVREAQAEGTTEFLENELQQMKVRLEGHEETLRSFRERSMGELPEQLETNLRTLDRLQIERQMLENSLKNAEDRYADLNRQLTGDAPGGGGSPSTGAGRLQALRTRLANLRTEYTEEYPDIVSLKRNRRGRGRPRGPDHDVDTPRHAGRRRRERSTGRTAARNPDDQTAPAGGGRADQGLRETRGQDATPRTAVGDGAERLRERQEKLSDIAG